MTRRTLLVMALLALAGCQAENRAAPADPFLFGPRASRRREPVRLPRSRASIPIGLPRLRWFHRRRAT